MFNHKEYSVRDREMELLYNISSRINDGQYDDAEDILRGLYEIDYSNIEFKIRPEFFSTLWIIVQLEKSKHFKNQWNI